MDFDRLLYSSKTLKYRVNILQNTPHYPPKYVQIPSKLPPKPFDISRILHFRTPNSSAFTLEFRFLVGFGSSVRLVGIIFTKPGTSPTLW